MDEVKSYRNLLLIVVFEAIFLVLLLLGNGYLDIYLTRVAAGVEQVTDVKELIILKIVPEILIIFYVAFIIFPTIIFLMFYLKDDKTIRNEKLKELHSIYDTHKKFKHKKDSLKRKKATEDNKNIKTIEEEYSNFGLEFYKKYMDTLSEI